MIIIATVLSYLLQSIYFAIIGYNYNKINFNSLVKIKLVQNENVGRNRETIIEILQSLLQRHFDHFLKEKITYYRYLYQES